MSRLPSVCILAGGVGSRLGDRVAHTPKPLLEVAGAPFLLHQLRLLATHGAEHVVISVGYRGAQIEERLGSRQFGIRIDYSYDAPGLQGTLSAIRRSLPLLPDRFLVLYGDTYLRLDYAEAARLWHQSGRLGLMTVLLNDDRWDTSNVLYEGGRVLRYDKRAPTSDMRWIDYGLGGLTARALDEVPLEESDLAALYARLADIGELWGVAAHERFYEIGTPESLAETEAFLREISSQ